MCFEKFLCSTFKSFDFGIDLKYLTVSSNPFCLLIFGCQFNIFLAKLISGCRLFGSPSGHGKTSIFWFILLKFNTSFAKSKTVISSGLPRLTG